MYIVLNFIYIWACPRENLPYGILLTVMLFACTVTMFAKLKILQIFENGIQLLACCIFIVWGIILLKWNFSTVQYKILRQSENMQFFHKGGFPMGPLIYYCRKTFGEHCDIQIAIDYEMKFKNYFTSSVWLSLFEFIVRYVYIIYL